MKALVTGATGLVGRRLVEKLGDAKVLSRDADRAHAALARFGNTVSAYSWAPELGSPPAKAFDNVDVVFHLAGEPVAAARWTPKQKQRIQASRVQGTTNLVAAIAALDSPPSVLVAASAVGYYGDRGDDLLDESAPGGSDFLAGVCASWEEQSLSATRLGLRVVVARIGVVLAPDGGALSRMLPPFRLGLGGRLGSGRQWMPWVHVDDVVGLLLHAASHDSITGPMNVVAPNPVTNRDFTRAIGRSLKRPVVLPVPRFGLRAAFGELSNVLLASQRVVPAVASKAGYHFSHPELEPALQSCLR